MPVVGKQRNIPRKHAIPINNNALVPATSYKPNPNVHSFPMSSFPSIFRNTFIPQRANLFVHFCHYEPQVSYP